MKNATTIQQLTPISNRQAAAGGSGVFELPTDGWYQIAPVGVFPHEVGIQQVIDPTALEAMVNSAGTPANIRVDYDHASYDPQKSSAAAGWVMALESRLDGLWGQIRWTPEGQAAVQNGTYRFLSPAWMAQEMQPVDPAKTKELRPLRLDSVGLTNNPNLRGMKPLSNRAGDAPHDEQKPNTNDRMKLVLTELGLAESQGENEILGAVRTLKNRVGALEAENKSLLASQVESDLITYDAVIDPGSKESVKAQLLANRAATIAVLQGIKKPVVASAVAGGATGQIHNRSTAKTPVAGVTAGAEEINNQRQTLIREIRNRNPGMTFGQSWEAAKAQKPELFRTDEAQGEGQQQQQQQVAAR